jgi:hypothetical protein
MAEGGNPLTGIQPANKNEQQMNETRNAHEILEHVV